MKRLYWIWDSAMSIPTCANVQREPGCLCLRLFGLLSDAPGLLSHCLILMLSLSLSPLKPFHSCVLLSWLVLAFPYTDLITANAG